MTSATTTSPRPGRSRWASWRPSRPVAPRSPSLHKTFDLWVAIGRAIVTLREKADRIGGRQTFKRLMAQNGFKMDGHRA